MSAAPFDSRLAEDLAEAPIGLLVVDAAGTIVWINSPAAQLFEWTVADLLGRSLETLIAPRQRDRHVRLREVYTSEPNPISHGPGRVLNGVTASGHEIAVEVTLVPLTRSAAGQVLALVENVGARLDLPAEPHTEAAQGERGERLYRAVFDQSYQATWVLSADGVVLAANRRARNIMLREDGGIGQDAVTVAFPRTTSSSRASLALGLDAAQEGEPVRLVLEDVDGGGAPRAHEVAVRPAIGDSGAPLFLVLEARDVTERRRREEELVAARLAAEAADRAKAAFLARMSHEMRTPLHAVLGFARLLQEEVGQPPERSDALRQIEGAGEQLLALVEDVLEIARIESGGLAASDSPANIRALLEDVAALARNAAGGRAMEVDCEVDAGLPTWLLIDEKKLRRALGDLLVHAVDVSTAGRVALEARWQPEGRRDRVALVVADTGPGLDPAEVSYLYSPFDRAEGLRSPGRTGLGLALARRLILLMGGEFRVESTSQQGSRFRIELPAHPVEGLRDRPEPEPTTVAAVAQPGLEGLKELPEEVSGELASAAAVADWQRLALAIARTAARWPELRRPLEAALDRFDYQAILAAVPTSRSVSSANAAQSGRIGATEEMERSSSSTGTGRENK